MPRLPEIVAPGLNFAKISPVLIIYIIFIYIYIYIYISLFLVVVPVKSWLFLGCFSPGGSKCSFLSIAMQSLQNGLK